MPLDMFQQTQSDTDAYVATQTAPRLPLDFGETFEKAWNENRLFGQSIAALNAHQDALGDYLDEVRRKSGVIVNPFNAQGDLRDPTDLAFEVLELKKKRPELDIPDITADEIDSRALKLSRMARADYQAASAAEKTFGGKAGMLLGGLAGGITDPVNLVAAPLAAPEGLGLLSTSLLWGAIAGTTQAANEAIGSPYRDRVQPGYSDSGEPAANILEAGGFGAATGGFFKAIGNIWTRAKTGTWPRSVRDAGNVVESETNVAQTNVLDGLQGEVAHREALNDTIDNLSTGRPVDVGEMPGPDPGKADALHEQARTGQEPEVQLAAEPEPEMPPAEAVQVEPETVARDLDHEAPDQMEAMLHDLDKQVAEGDVQIPAGLDQDGNPQFRNLRDMLDEVKADRDSADALQACLTGADEEANAE